MVVKAASKIDTTDAQESLEGLQQVGEGWYRQVALAVRQGVPIRRSSAPTGRPL